MAILVTAAGTLSGAATAAIQSILGSQASATAAHGPQVRINANTGTVLLQADTAEELKNLGRQILEIAHNFGAR